MDAVQSTMEKLGSQMTEAETRISALEDQGQTQGATVEAKVKTPSQLQETITYLEDAGHGNNIRIVGMAEDTEGRDMQGFLKKLISEALDIALVISAESS